MRDPLLEIERRFLFTSLPPDAGSPVRLVQAYLPLRLVDQTADGLWLGPLRLLTPERIEGWDDALLDVLADDRSAARIRLAGDPESPDDGDEAIAWFTLKGPRDEHGVNVELEAEVEPAVAVRAMALPGGLSLVKDRHTWEGPDGHLWDLDVFAGELEGLRIAEVELSHLEEALELPTWLGREITADLRYTNLTLARHGVPGA